MSGGTSGRRNALPDGLAVVLGAVPGVGLDYQDQASHEAELSSAAAAATSPASEARMVGKAPRGIAWLSTRSGYSTPFGVEPLPGVACLLFEVGACGVGWLACLSRSSWFTGLEPWAEDLAISGGVPFGHWAMPDGAAAAEGTRAAAEAFFALKTLPNAWLAMVAVPRGARLADQAAALGLVDALRARQDPGGRALSVVVTADVASSTATDAFVRRLLNKGAFVVRAGEGTGAAGDHLHHFPLRAFMDPRRGRLVCVDVADYLYIWRPGWVADLHVVPFAGGDAGHALRGVPLLADGSVRALTLGFHLEPDAPDQGLVEVDRFATVCRELLLAPDEDVVFTTMDRLDGVTGSVDVLVIHDKA